jgi:2-methylcitrate dehydratase PrpD
MSIAATEHLAHRLATIRFQDLDEQTIAKAKMCVLDQLGCMLLGSSVPWTRSVLRYVTSRGGVPEARVVNQGTSLPANAAGMINAVYGQACELDDYTVRGWGAGHAGATAVPVGLAVGELQRASGAEFITAVVAGYEAMSRIGKSVRPSSDRRGFHMHGIISPFGSAATAGSLLRLSEGQMTMALGIAASHSAGTMEYDQTGGEVKRLHSGIGARSGIDAVFLSLEGLTAPPTALEGKRGFCNVFSDEPKLDELTVDQPNFAINEAAFKMYPCVATLSSSIQALGMLADREGFGPEDVTAIRVGLNEGSLLHGGAIYEPTDVLSAQFSLPYSLAIRLVFGGNHLKYYMDSRTWTDSRVQTLAHKAKSYVKEDAVGDLRHACDMSVALNDGTELGMQLDYPKGSFFNPFTQDDVKEKFREVVRDIVGPDVAERVIAAVDDLDSCSDVTGMVTLLCGER